MDQNPKIDLEEMETMCSILDFDMLMEKWESNMIASSLTPNDTPAEEWGPQEPQTECYMPLGVAPLSLEQPILPVPGFHATQADFSFLALSDALAEIEFGPQEPQTECNMPPGAAPLSLEQLVLPEPGFHAAQTNFPLLPLYDAPAEGGFGPQQPQTEWYLPLGAAPFTLQEQDVSATEFQAAQTGLPPLPPYYAPAEEMFGPQQPQTDSYMPVGAAPFSLQNPVMPAPEQAPPMYQPPTVMQPNHMYYQGASSNHSQYNNVPVVSLPQGTELTPIGYINGEICYGIANCSAPPVASDVFVIKSNTPKCYTKLHDESQPYVKKPPNAFMIFLMEQRPHVMAEIQNYRLSTVDKVIGKRWKSMSKEEQARYYEYARRGKQIQNQLFPGWSGKYAKRKMRIRRKGPSTTEDYVI